MLNYTYDFQKNKIISDSEMPFSMSLSFEEKNALIECCGADFQKATQERHAIICYFCSVLCEGKHFKVYETCIQFHFFWPFQITTQYASTGSLSK